MTHCGGVAKCAEWRPMEVAILPLQGMLGEEANGYNR